VTDLLAPIGLTVLAAAATGFCTWHCVRGLRRGGCAPAAAEPDQLRRAREELAELKREAQADSGDHNDMGRPRVQVPHGGRDRFV